MVWMCSSAMNAKNEKNVEGHHRKWVQRPGGFTRMAPGWTSGVFGNYGDGCLLGHIAGDQSGLPLLKVQNLKSS